MADSEKEETLHLEKEFRWVLKEEVHLVFQQLQTILAECVKRFPVPIFSYEGQQKQDKYTLTSPNDNVKCNVHVNGDTITFGEISFKVQRHQVVTYRTAITHDNPWKLQQVQDAGNHLQMALLMLTNLGEDYTFKTSEEVLHILGNILGALQRGRTALIVPRKKTMDELMKSKNMKQLVPNLPEDIAVSFYIQSHKLVFAVYQLQLNSEGGGMTFNTFQGEASMPWTNEVLVLFTVALQLAQQLKDKISVFSIYKDFQVASNIVKPVIQLDTV